MENHINQKYDEDLSELVNGFLRVAGLVENQLEAVRLLIDTEQSTHFDIIKRNEKTIDEQEIELDRKCANIIALRQPTASDLRLILAISRSIRDLERMSDELDQVAELMMSIFEKTKERFGSQSLVRFTEHISEALTDVLESFSRFDLATSMQYSRMDKKINAEFQSTTREMITYMIEDPRNISDVLNVLWAIRSLERVADHVSNIAEQLIYSAKGLDVRHLTKKQMQQLLDDSQ